MYNLPTPVPAVAAAFLLRSGNGTQWGAAARNRDERKIHSLTGDDTRERIDNGLTTT
ncbi:MAG: hypothetical protein NTT76_06565 [Achromobacter xylosoxidans]|nr:hypothetical protein [Achromobacter xylosoxidans]